MSSSNTKNTKNTKNEIINVNNMIMRPNDLNVCYFYNTPKGLRLLDNYFSVIQTTGHHNNCGLDCLLIALMLGDDLDKERERLGFGPKAMLSFDELCIVAELHQVAILCVQFSDYDIVDNNLCYGGSMTFQLYGNKNSHDCVVLINTVNHYTLINSLKRNSKEREIIKPMDFIKFFEKLMPEDFKKQKKIFGPFFELAEEISDKFSKEYGI